MKRKAFTLSEILIAAAIIGVIAAVTFANINTIVPDRDKVEVLKVYKTLNDVNNEIFNNPSLYMYNSQCEQAVLQCKDKPLDSSTNTRHNSANFEGLSKYPYLLAENLVISKDVSNSSKTYTFATTDGIEWTLVATASSTNSQVPQEYTVTIDVGNPHRMACSYSNSCQNPGQFQFRVNANGSVTAMDALSQAYLRNPDDLSDRSADLKVAKLINATPAPTPAAGSSVSSSLKPTNEKGNDSSGSSSSSEKGEEIGQGGSSSSAVSDKGGARAKDSQNGVASGSVAMD